MVTPSIHEQCWEPTTNLEHIRKCIQNGHHIMVIMRGIPGSGKSYLARENSLKSTYSHEYMYNWEHMNEHVSNERWKI
ncbi:unnamed protein product [Brugia timori]|uniref:NEDD4-binding protein 2-like 1 n=1 Tax=Brugia timori TaxID=42155 RepID=A0A0R3QR00_9BILA|nr:unnamed protein product [Brugia timori]